MDKLMKLTNEFIDKMDLKKDKRVSMILLQGSIIYGGIDKYSDIDLMVVANKKIPVRERIKKISKFSDIVRDTGEKFKNRDMFYYKNVEFNVEYVYDIKNMQNYDILNSKIIYNPKKFKLKKPKLSKKEIIEITHVFMFMCENFDERLEKYAKRKEWLIFNGYLNQFYTKMIGSLYMLNGFNFYIFSHASADFKKFRKKPKNFEKRLTKILNTPNSKWELKIKLLKSLSNDIKKMVEKKYGKFKTYHKRMIK